MCRLGGHFQGEFALICRYYSRSSGSCWIYTQIKRIKETKACQLLAKLLALTLPAFVVLEPQESEAKRRLDIQVIDGNLRVVIEVKWADHKNVNTALKNQLYERYLAKQPDVRGIYLVLWYAPDMLHEAQKSRVHKRWGSDTSKLELSLRKQADQVGQVEPFMLKLRRSPPPQ